jgi:hypothetical protein
MSNKRVNLTRPTVSVVTWIRSPRRLRAVRLDGQGQMDSAGTRVAIFDSECQDCGAQFAEPHLGDMVYGAFIARGDKGTAFAYLNAIREPAWDVVKGVHRQVSRSRLNRVRAVSSVECFQWLIGRCLDPIDGQQLSIVSWAVCPQCHSHNVIIHEARKLGSFELPSASFASFLALSSRKRRSFVRGQCRTWLRGER